jgi:cellulose synthase/poly-beta-1,6-N-acetylglucosamine synthase-like glycosyltransferase
LIFVALKSIFIKSRKTTLTPQPAVTLVVAAYNEEEIIAEKINNCLTLGYPSHLMHFIFVTDGSTDQTVGIVKQYPELLHLHQPQRAGKLAAVNNAMEHVKTDIVIFTDANTMLNKQSITNIVRHYTDPKVGGVAGEKKVLAADGGSVAKGEGAYWKYESFLKNLDSRLCTVVGAAGELFSMRTSLYTRLPGNIIIEDFVQSLSVCLKNYVVRYEPQAYAVEQASFSMTDEMERKIRISAGGFQAIVFLKKLLNVFSYPVVAFQYISHRVLRWTFCPIALIVLFLTTVRLAFTYHSFYSWFATIQVIGYVMALIGWGIARQNRHPGTFYLPFYFVFMNFCVFAGFSRYISGKQGSAWKKAARGTKNND